MTSSTICALHIILLRDTREDEMAGHVACMGINKFKTLSKEFKEKRPFGRYESIWDKADL
jgi:hypothetical protein